MERLGYYRVGRVDTPRGSNSFHEISAKGKRNSQEAEEDENYYGNPGHRIENPAVGMFFHDGGVIYQFKHKNQDDG